MSRVLKWWPWAALVWGLALTAAAMWSWFGVEAAWAWLGGWLLAAFVVELFSD